MRLGECHGAAVDLACVHEQRSSWDISPALVSYPTQSLMAFGTATPSEFRVQYRSHVVLSLTALASKYVANLVARYELATSRDVTNWDPKGSFGTRLARVGLDINPRQRFWDERSWRLCAMIWIRNSYHPIDAVILWCDVSDHEDEILQADISQPGSLRKHFPQWPRLHDHVECIYDASLSGELPATYQGPAGYAGESCTPGLLLYSALWSLDLVRE